jgi:hypothetical protein
LKTDLEAAHKFCIRHKSQLILDEKCGCFNCLKIFSPKEIERWLDDGADFTAICPYCGIDTVIGQKLRVPDRTGIFAANESVLVQRAGRIAAFRNSPQGQSPKNQEPRTQLPEPLSAFQHISISTHP